jgi:hypothetical protein
VLPICRHLKPISGYAGIGLIEPLDLSIGAEFHPVVRQLAERFPGLEVESNPVTCNHVKGGIKGVDWLTVLDERWVKEVGGLDYLRIRLDEPTFPFYLYDGGLIIQAGPRPQIGDATRNLWPRNYVTLARVLKKIQIKEHLPFHFGTPGITSKMDHAATTAWISRFDGK